MDVPNPFDDPNPNPAPNDQNQNQNRANGEELPWYRELLREEWANILYNGVGFSLSLVFVQPEWNRWVAGCRAGADPKASALGNVMGCPGGVAGRWVPLFPEGYIGVMAHVLVGKWFAYLMVRWGWLIWVDLW